MLGANLGSNIGAPKYFTLPSDPLNRKFAVNPDPCHMLKNARNAFGDYKVFINSEGKRIEWQILEKLVILQENEELHLGNKLRKADIFFQNQKMKVRLAVQLLSKSVADALDFCSKELKLKQFENSEATSECIRLFNDIFDVLNSRKLTDFGYQKALCKANFNELKILIDKSINYIKGLMQLDKEGQPGKTLITSQRKTGFLCMIACLNNIQIIHERFTASDMLLYVPFIN